MKVLFLRKNKANNYTTQCDCMSATEVFAECEFKEFERFFKNNQAHGSKFIKTHYRMSNTYFFTPEEMWEKLIIKK